MVIQAEAERILVVGPPVDFAESCLLIGSPGKSCEKAPQKVVDGGALLRTSSGKAARGNAAAVPGAGGTVNSRRVDDTGDKWKIAELFFGIEEEKELIFDDWAADAAAKLVAGFGRVETGERIAGIKIANAGKPIACTVKVICPANR